MENRVRLKLNWSPQWDGPLKNWAKAYIFKNLWRCDPIYSEDDLLQEAYLIYQKLCERYPRVNCTKHFFALFKTSLRNYIHDLSRLQRLRMEALDYRSDDELVQRIGELANEGELNVLCEQIPPLKAAVEYLLCSSPSIRVDHNETLNMELWRVTGYTNYNFSQELKKLLT